MRVPRFDPSKNGFLEIADISKKQHQIRKGTNQNGTLRNGLEKTLEDLVKEVCT